MPGQTRAAKLTAVTDEEWDAIKLSGGPGRAAKPSTQLDNLTEAVAAIPKLNADDPKAGWYRLPATQANTVEVITRELRKGVKQLNADRNDGTAIKLETRPRKDHPKLGNFVAFRVSIVPVESAETERAS